MRAASATVGPIVKHPNAVSSPAHAGDPVFQRQPSLSRWAAAYWIARMRGRRHRGMGPHSRDINVRVFHLVPPSLDSEGAGKTGCTPHPRSRVQCAQRSAHTSIQVWLRHPGLPCAMVLRLIRARPGETLLGCHHHPRLALDLSRTCHLHRGGRPTRLHRPPHVHSSCTLGVHRICTHVPDDAQRPSCRVR